ncbi:MAG: flagellar basal body P-ring formation chaperone FlgA [Pseudobdellovibrio sp.]
MKQIIRFLLVFFPMIVLAQKQMPEITFSSAVEISPRSMITAFDVVETKNMSDELMENLKEIKLGDSSTIRIEKTELAHKLRSVHAKFILPSEMKLLKSRNPISRMELERKIKNHITKNCAECDLQIQISSVPMNVTADWELDLNIDLTKTSVIIPIRSINNPEKKGWVVGEIKRYQSVPVLNRAVKTGDVITQDLISVEKRLIMNPREIIANSQQLMGMQAARFLNAGQAITYSDLKKEQVMKKGQMIKAIAGQSSVEVSILAQVEEAGAIGDVIRIRNLDSQKIVAARVVDKGLVRIE